MATSLAAASLLFAIFFSTLTSLTNQYPVSNKTKGFSIGLIHRDSPLSPLYNPNATTTDRRNAARSRSKRRYESIRSALAAKNSMQALNVTVVQTEAEYLMNITIGNPPFPIMVFMDTGSDIMWIQCAPCKKCFHQAYPIYDPINSNTYRGVVCPSDDCDKYPSTFCTRDTFCGYEIDYVDGAHSDGQLATEDVAFMGVDGHPTSFPGIIFGCGDNNTGTYDAESNGMAGLGAGPLSLIDQLAENGVPKKFSHCFMPEPERISHMIIGRDKGTALPDTAQWTELVLKKVGGQPFYIANMEGISVAGEMLPIDHSSFSGGTLVDTGTTLIQLSDIVYYQLRGKLEEVITLEREETKGEPGGLCYRGTTSDMYDVKKVPFVTLHFKGLYVPLNPLKTFWEWTSGVWCLAMAPGAPDDSLSIIGNHAMQDMYVRYDLEEMKLYLASVDCTRIDDH